MLASCGDVPAPAFYRPGGPEEDTAWEGFELDFVLHLLEDGAEPAWEVTEGRFGGGGGGREASDVGGAGVLSGGDVGGTTGGDENWNRSPGPSPGGAKHSSPGPGGGGGGFRGFSGGQGLPSGGDERIASLASLSFEDDRSEYDRQREIWQQQQQQHLRSPGGVGGDGAVGLTPSRRPLGGLLGPSPIRNRIGGGGGGGDSLGGSFGSNVSMRSSARGGGLGGGSVAGMAASIGGISLKPATEHSVHDVIFRAYKTPQNVNANREDAVRVVRWLAHMDARVFKPASSSSLSPSAVVSSTAAAKTRHTATQLAPLLSRVMLSMENLLQEYERVSLVRNGRRRKRSTELPGEM